MCVYENKCCLRKKYVFNMLIWNIAGSFTRDIILSMSFHSFRFVNRHKFCYHWWKINRFSISTYERTYYTWKKYEDTKGLIRLPISKKNKQLNDQKKKSAKGQQRPTNHTYKTKERVTRTPLSGVIKQYVVVAWHTIGKPDIHL